MWVHLRPGLPARAEVVAVDLDTRARSPRIARRTVKRAFRGRLARAATILFKKIDSTLRGHVSAELAAARRALGRRPVLFSPAFPAQKRTVREARLFLHGAPASGDLRALLSGAGLPAAHLGLAAIRGGDLDRVLADALATGARALACDAERDSDLDALARAGLKLRPRPLFVGSAGLARALARTLRARQPAPCPSPSRRPVLTVVGSASAVSVRQARAVARQRAGALVQLVWHREPAARDRRAVRRLGRAVAQAAPPAHYVLTGGETARAVLGALGIVSYRLLAEVEPGVPFGLAPDGTLVCTKAGAFGGPETLVRCVARLKRKIKDS